MYLLDANIFLEIVFDQKYFEECQSVIDRLNQDSSGYLTSFSLHGIEAMLGPKNRGSVLKQWLKQLLSHPYMGVYETSLEEEIKIINIMHQTGLDFDDSLQYYVAKKQGFTLVTLDQDFKRVGGISVKSPEEVIG